MVFVLIWLARLRKMLWVFFLACVVLGEAAWLVMGAIGFAGDLSLRAALLCCIGMSTFLLLWESCRPGKSQ